jgi:predicted Zn-dependent protease
MDAALIFSLKRALPAVALLLLTSCAGAPMATAPLPALPPMEAELPGGFGRYPDERLQGYVQGVGDRVTRALDRGVRLRFTVTDNPGFAAVVTRHGNVYISRGLLALLLTEAELAAVFAHEVAHHLSGHSRKTETEALSTLTRSDALARRIGGRDTRELTTTFSRALVKGRVREQELEADRLSIGYLVRAGYDPQAAIDALQLLAVLAGESEPTTTSGLDEDGYTPPIFRDHPEPSQRIAAMSAEVRGRRNPLSPGDNHRDAFLRAIDGLVLDGDGRDFVRRNGRLYLPGAGLSLHLQDRWFMHSQNPGRVTLRTMDDRFRLIVVPREKSGRRVTHDFIAVLAGQDRDRKPVTMEAGAYRGQRHDGTMALGRGRVRVDAVYLDDGQNLFRLYVLAELATPAPELRKQTDALLRRLSVMSDADRALAQPWRLRIRVAGKNLRYEDLAKSAPLPEVADTHLRVLNRQFPPNEPKPGEIIKIIQ